MLIAVSKNYDVHIYSQDFVYNMIATVKYCCSW